MNLESVDTHSRARIWRRLIATGVILVAALAALAGIGRLAQATPEVTQPDVPDACPGKCFDVVESFEGTPLSVWQLTGHVNGPRWNFRSITQTYGLAHSSSHSMWFANPATGEYGGIGCESCPVYSGSLTYVGTPVPLPVGDARAYLSFWSWEYTEMSELPQGFSDTCLNKPTCPFDVRRVYISGTNPADAHWELLWSTDVNGTAERIWHNVVLDISGYIGQGVRMRFTFSTDPSGTDGWNNDGRGWYVDDVRLYTFTPFKTVYLPEIYKNK